MERDPGSITGVLRVLLASVFLLAGGCASTVPVPVETVVVVVAEPEPVEIPVAIVEPEPEIIHVPAPPPIVRPVRKKTNIAVVLSSRQPAYESVATELQSRLDQSAIYDLDDKSLPPTSVFRAINDSDVVAVVAIGLRAAISATSMANVPVVFCQVFNYDQHELLTDRSRGVSSLPPLDLQIAAWKKIDPSLQSIGAIVGPGHEELLEEAQLAAFTHGIELKIRTVTSDREMLYVFSRLVDDIDGFWLFPDNRVLSGPVMKEMMLEASRHRVRVAVFNDSLLAMGASLSSVAIESDIADTISSLLQRIATGDLANIPPMTGLSDVRVVTNDALLRQNLAAETVAGQ